MECNHGVSTGGSQKGTLTSDGGTYAIWEHQQVNQPSIQGTSTFQQYFSIRQDCASSGTVTIQNHFKAWAAQNMNLGSLNYQVVSVESWSGAGSATQQVTNDGSGAASPAPAPASPAPAPSTGGGGGGNTGSCSAIWGQCGGQGWSGPTCCSQGTCKSNGQYYSQCVQ
jgi:endo-1,4-beta-xylanase